MYVSPKNEQIAMILRACGYTTNKDVSLAKFPDKGMQIMPDFWDGGVRSRYSMVKLDTMQVVNPPAQAFLGPLQCVSALPLGCVFVEHQEPKGYTTIYGDLLTALPAPVVDEDVKNAVLIVDNLISSYRLKEAQRMGYTLREYESLKERAVALGYLKKNGGVTTEGRNLVEGLNLWSRKKGG